jgi:hypothetical protein
VKSLQSNGISEACGRTPKCDYVQVTLLPSAEAVLALLPAWFADYNTNTNTNTNTGTPG